MAAANRYLTEQFIPQHNARFMVRATETGTAFIPWVGMPSPRSCVCKKNGSWPRTTPSTITRRIKRGHGGFPKRSDSVYEMAML